MTKVSFELGQDGSAEEDKPSLGEMIATSREATSKAALLSTASRTSAGSLLTAKRHRKDCPREISSHRPVPAGRTRCLGIINNTLESHGGRERPCDPRFESQCGNLSEDHIARNFKFVDDLREREKAQAKMLLHADPKNDALRARVRAMEAEDSRRRAYTRRMQIRADIKREEKEKVKMGKKPFFPKESDIRERELQAKFADLKASGGVRKFIERRRKRNTSKDRKLLPSRRFRNERENSESR